MKGDNGVIEQLNKLLGYELAARDQYFIHSEMYEDLGLKALYERLHHEMEEETEHAQRLIRRILFLEGTPDTGRADMMIGSDVPEMLKNDLAMELDVVGMLRDVIAYCESVNDYVSRELLEELLDDTESDHTYWLEQQLRLIDMIGLENYLQSQTGSGE